RDVGRQHDAPGVVRLEDPHLLLRGEAGKQREDFSTRRVVLAEGLGGLAGLALARGEDQWGSRGLAPEVIDRPADGLFLGALTVIGVVGGERAVSRLDGVRAAGDFEDGYGRMSRCGGEQVSRRIGSRGSGAHRRDAYATGVWAEVIGEALGIDGCAGDN